MHIVTQPTKLTPQQQQSLQIKTYCPVTGWQVEGTYRRHFILSRGQLTWWHCDVCHELHASIIDV